MKKRKSINYSELARKLKPYVDFKIDLRKTRLSTREKGRLNKAWREIEPVLRQYQTGRFVPIRPGKGESATDYKLRLEKTRNEWGQGDSPIAGVWSDQGTRLSKARATRKKDGSTKIVFSGVDKKFRLVTEEFIPINPLISAKNLREAITVIYNTRKFETIYPYHSGWRGAGRGNTKIDMQRLIAKITKWANQYKGSENWLTGFLITTRAEK